jgi:hypothetical protein
MPSYLWTPLSHWSLPEAPYVMSMKHDNRFSGTCVVLTMDATDPDIRVLMIGGGVDGGPFPMGATGAEFITYRKDAGTGLVDEVGAGWTHTNSMLSMKGRADGNAVLLPDGTVFAVGGEVGPDLTDQNLDCEIFTPDGGLGQWSPAASLQHPRGHHSIALLLPDGRVFAAGHENGTTDLTYEIYYPPYLFANATTWATREVIETWPDPEDLNPDTPLFVSYGLPFEITVADDDASDIDEVVLMAPCAVTHATTFSQSRIRLSHADVPGDLERLVVSGPKDSTYAPEGYYLLFVIDDEGVPSEGRWVKVQAPDASQFVVPVGDAALWGGDVWLTRDFEVEGSLTILAGTTVHVHADATSASYTGGSSLIDIGTALLGSIKADGVTFTTFDGTGSPDEWGGLVFNTGSNYYDPTGKYSPIGAASSVTNSTIEHAESGIRIVNQIAPTIAGNTFADNSADILIDTTDAVIPDIAYWDLEAPIAVQGTQSMSPVGDALFGTSGKTNLIAQGPLVTRNDVGSVDDRVTFHPDVITPDGSPSGSNDWGGIFLDSHAAGSVLEWADIGYASNPVFVREPSDVIIRNSTIHHFASTGLWVNGAHDATSPGLVVESTIIDRGELADASLGKVGVFLDQATNVQFGGPGAENLVMLHGASDLAGGYGILVAQEKGTCEAAGPTETIRIANTTVVGPGVSPDPVGDWSGIRFNWVCGTADRTVELVDNWIEKCDFAGLDLEQAVDVQATCNKVVESRRGVSFSRDGASGGPGVRFRENSFEQVSDGDQAAVATDASLKVKMGPEASGTKGRNVFRVWHDETSFFDNDDGSTGVLDATYNYWYLQTASGEEFLHDDYPDEHPDIDDRCRTSGGADGSADAVVNTLSYKKSDLDVPTCPTRHPEAPSASRIAGPLAGSAVGPVSEGPLRLDAAIPTVTSLGRPFPNPTSGGISVPFALAQGQAGSVRVDVFDVRGRRVRTLVHDALAPARYRLDWPGVDAAGKRVSPGTYFIRFRAGEHVQTAKVTVLR